MDLSLLALRLEELRGLANSAIRETRKPVADNYQYEIVSIAEELLREVEAELASRSAAAARVPDRR